MKAVRMHRFGGPETLSLDDIETPEPRQGRSADPGARGQRQPGRLQDPVRRLSDREAGGTADRARPRHRGRRRTQRAGRRLQARRRNLRSPRTRPRRLRGIRHRQGRRVRAEAAALEFRRSGRCAARPSGQRVLVHGGAGASAISPSSSRKRKERGSRRPSRAPTRSLPCSLAPIRPSITDGSGLKTRSPRSISSTTSSEAIHRSARSPCSRKAERLSQPFSRRTKRFAVSTTCAARSTWRSRARPSPPRSAG